MILKNYIIPKNIKKLAFPKKSIVFSDDQLNYILDHLPYEPGCRKLNDAIRQIISELNLKRFKTEHRPSLTNLSPSSPNAFRLPYFVTLSDIEKITKPMKIYPEKTHQKSTIGYINGLYTTDNGMGGILPIQVIASKKITEDIITGNNCEAMKECITVARTLTLQEDSDFLELIKANKAKKMGIHVHTEYNNRKRWAIGRGPCNFVILSALYEFPINYEVAVSGEIDLFGNILPVNGIYEKLVGAKKAGIKYVLIPEPNMYDIEESLKKGQKSLNFYQ